MSMQVGTTNGILEKQGRFRKFFCIVKVLKKNGNPFFFNTNKRSFGLVVYKKAAKKIDGELILPYTVHKAICL